ncbi:hypothetical protein SAMN05216571_101233 [Onishia taeanensis]|uniref:Uncharacterized protein n=1 Tax=Onishia taeanensis TaxID=284577 RepID=A0A1G7N537_9GAMM|nr:hypothetical protein [Halomonas taeanensis]SDF69124.1 hypothetical protein SAMN05216571_101233 [Halomonas taeanensis]
MQPHTTASPRPARVYLHPAAATSVIAVRAIERVTGRLAHRERPACGIRLITEREAHHLYAQQNAGQEVSA